MAFEETIEFKNKIGCSVSLPISEVGDKTTIEFLGSTYYRVVCNERKL